MLHLLAMKIVPQLLAILIMASSLALHAAPGVDVEAQYQDARHCYYNLLNDTQRQKRRDQWEPCINKFLNIAQQATKHERAPAALYSAAKTYELLFQASKNRDDLRAASKSYQLVAQHYKQNRLADDALYRASVIEWEAFRDRKRSKKLLNRIVRNHAKGDQVGPAKKLLKQIDSVKNGQHRSFAALAQIKPTPMPLGTKHTPKQQLRIVIDPGHGGKDPGALGAHGTTEKYVTLKISKKLKKHLEQRLGAKVTLTRTTDRTLSLDKRNAIANKHKADLFISIHANAHSSREQHGIQTYYLNNATDKAAQKLAARENASMGKQRSELDEIMSTMLQNAFTDQSRDLATHVHKNLVGRLRKHYGKINDQNVRSALFYVLVGAKSPSILVETSYLSNPREEERLRNSKYQDLVARGIADGIAQYLKTKRNGGML